MTRECMNANCAGKGTVFFIKKEGVFYTYMYVCDLYDVCMYKKISFLVFLLFCSCYI